MAIINMQTMRYINLLDKFTHVKTSKCFTYNNTIFFAVRQKDISKAIGLAATNIKKMQLQLGKKVKVIKKINSISEAKSFIENIVSPIKLKDLEIKDNQMIITAGSMQNKAILIGRNKQRLEELKLIIGNIFNMDVRIV